MVQWKREAILGRGGFATVSLASISGGGFPAKVAVKSSPEPCSTTLRKEKHVLSLLKGCPQVIQCLGEDISFECVKMYNKVDDTFFINRVKMYNIFLELAPHGSLSDLVDASKANKGGLSVRQVQCYTKSILLGLAHVHKKGYVHCDIKPDNILVWSSEDAKIADFGLAKKSGEKLRGSALRGTPLYIAPESVRHSEYESPCDIWALGLTVIEMATGESAWNFPENMEVTTKVRKIGRGEAAPEIPEELPEAGKDFLRRCLVREPGQRWTAEKLLNHPFVPRRMAVAWQKRRMAVQPRRVLSQIPALRSSTLS